MSRVDMVWAEEACVPLEKVEIVEQVAIEATDRLRCEEWRDISGLNVCGEQGIARRMVLAAHAHFPDLPRRVPVRRRDQRATQHVAEFGLVHRRHGIDVALVTIDCNEKVPRGCAAAPVEEKCAGCSRTEPAFDVPLPPHAAHHFVDVTNGVECRGIVATKRSRFQRIGQIRFRERRIAMRQTTFDGCGRRPGRK